MVCVITVKDALAECTPSEAVNVLVIGLALNGTVWLIAKVPSGATRTEFTWDERPPAGTNVIGAKTPPVKPRPERVTSSLGTPLLGTIDNAAPVAVGVGDAVDVLVLVDVFVGVLVGAAVDVFVGVPAGSGVTEKVVLPEFPVLMSTAVIVARPTASLPNTVWVFVNVPLGLALNVPVRAEPDAGANVMLITPPPVKPLPVTVYNVPEMPLVGATVTGRFVTAAARALAGRALTWTLLRWAPPPP